MASRISGRLRGFFFLGALTIAGLFFGGAAATAQTAEGIVRSPQAFLGFRVGEDRKLADYKTIAAYFKELAAASPRVKLWNYGKTHQQNDILLAVISLEENLRQLGEHQRIARRLAGHEGRITPEEIQELSQRGKVFVLVTCSIHASEIGPSQASMEMAHELATAPRDSKLGKQLADVIFLLVPSLNPDGIQMEVDWYKRWLGTPYEGGRMPWLYHPYAGHDNNRDHVQLTQPESKALAKILYHDFHAAVYLDAHQMGSTGPRMFVPPFQDPVAPMLHPLLMRSLALIGTNMSYRLEEGGKAGVIDRYQFDAYWPGGTRNTSCWKNVAGLLTEIASARLATPIFIEETELVGGGKGLPEYKRQANFPNPWPGGWWRLRDIVDYELIAVRALIETSSLYREDLLRNFGRMAQEQIREGMEGSVKAYVLPADQSDPSAAARLARLMALGNVHVYKATAEIPGDRYSIPKNSWIIPLDQPYGRFVREMMMRQQYPEIKPSEESKPFRPYDVTGWTLPLQMGVSAVAWTERLSPDRMERVPNVGPSGRIEGAAEARFIILPATQNGSFATANRLATENIPVQRVRRRATDKSGPALSPGDFVVEPKTAEQRRSTQRIIAESDVVARGEDRLPNAELARHRRPRVAVFKSYAAGADEGWTRYVLEEFRFSYTSLNHKEVRGDLRDKFDVIILPDLSKGSIMEGSAEDTRDTSANYTRRLPPEYQGGIGKEGAKALKDFVGKGGILVAMGRACDVPTDEFNIPVRSALEKGKEEAAGAPGTLVKAQFRTDHPLTYGLAESGAIFLTRPVALRTMQPDASLDRTVIAQFPDEPLLLSGWLRGEEQLRRKAAAVEVRQGQGWIVLYPFRVQNRGQMEGTYKLLFNAILR